MAKPKRAKQKKNPVRHVRESDIQNLKREVVGQSYRTFMAVALTTVLDKYGAGTGNRLLVSPVMEKLHDLRRSFPEAAEQIDDIISSTEPLIIESWVSQYLQAMNSLVDEISEGRITVDDLAQELDDEYDIRLDYREI